MSSPRTERPEGATRKGMWAAGGLIGFEIMMALIVTGLHLRGIAAILLYVIPVVAVWYVLASVN